MDVHVRPHVSKPLHLVQACILRILTGSGSSGCTGDTYLLLDRSLQELVQHLARPLQHHIEMSWPVHKIEYGREGAVLHGPHGRRKSCRQVLVTASLAVLQRGDITFEPPLPEAKQQALSRLKMTNAIKVMQIAELLPAA